MESRQFVDAIRQVVRDSAINSTNRLIADQPDRLQWLQSLGLDDRRHLQDIIALSADVTVFGFLCVLDGVRAIENGPNKGVLRLLYSSSKGQELLNDPNAEPLHDIYKQIGEP